MHKKTNDRPYWDFRGKGGWNVGVPLEQYRWQLIVAKYTKEVLVSYTVGFCHHYLTQPTITHADIILHGINMLSCDLIDAPTVACDAQLGTITELRDLFQW